MNQHRKGHLKLIKIMLVLNMDNRNLEETKCRGETQSIILMYIRIFRIESSEEQNESFVNKIWDTLNHEIVKQKLINTEVQWIEFTSISWPNY